MMHKTDSVHYMDTRATVAWGSESGSIYAQGTIMKRVRGVVHSQFVGLVRKVGTRTHLRIRWARSEERSFVIGQQAVATIPAEAVRLESGCFGEANGDGAAGWGGLF